MPDTDHGTSRDFAPYLAATQFVDSDHPEVMDFSEKVTAGADDDVEKAVRLYYAVRDQILYDPYTVDTVADHYRASTTLRAGRGFCVPKATLLAAAARVAGIPARVGYADVRNHLSTKRLLDLTGTDLFIYHGYVEIWLDGRWVKCTPAFNLQLCEKFRVMPLEFDGRTDSLFHPFNADGDRHMEYVRDRGAFADVPFDEMKSEFERLYPALLRHNTERRRGDFAREAEAENLVRSS
ncbi:MAG: transglutaminase domain-containing protein [Alphaproteobacteria bacterium]|nr:transglutaminase domain-containing protein [Alphaproteobacteria bacterium]